MNFTLQIANGLWNSGHFYAAVLLFMPVQIAWVLLHNFQLWAVLVIGNSMTKGTK